MKKLELNYSSQIGAYCHVPASFGNTPHRIALDRAHYELAGFMTKKSIYYVRRLNLDEHINKQFLRKIHPVLNIDFGVGYILF